MKLNLVCDTSGSMCEWGKHLVTRGVARMVEQYLRFGYGQAKLQIFSWSDDIHLVDWNTDQEFPSELMSPGHSSVAKILIDHFGYEPDGRILMLTDGFWSDHDFIKIKSWMERLRPDALRVIIVGNDDNPRLKGPNIFCAEESLVALDGWLKGDSA